MTSSSRLAQRYYGLEVQNDAAVVKFIKESVSDVENRALSAMLVKYVMYGVINLCGRLGERKLHHDTKMLALMKANPQAQWIIRTDNNHS